MGIGLLRIAWGETVHQFEWSNKAIDIHIERFISIGLYICLDRQASLCCNLHAMHVIGEHASVIQPRRRDYLIRRMSEQLRMTVANCWLINGPLLTLDTNALLSQEVKVASSSSSVSDVAYIYINRHFANTQSAHFIYSSNQQTILNDFVQAS